MINVSERKKSENLLHHLGSRTCLRSSVRLSIKRLKEGQSCGWGQSGEGGDWGKAGREDQHSVIDNSPGRYFPNFFQRRWSLCTFLPTFWTENIVFLDEMSEVLTASSKPDPQSQWNTEIDLPGMIKNLLYNQSQVLWVTVAFWPIRCWPEDGCTYLFCCSSNWLQARSACVKSEVGNVLCSGWNRRREKPSSQSFGLEPSQIDFLQCPRCQPLPIVLHRLGSFKTHFEIIESPYTIFLRSKCW